MLSLSYPLLLFLVFIIFNAVEVNLPLFSILEEISSQEVCSEYIRKYFEILPWICWSDHKTYSKFNIELIHYFQVEDYHREFWYHFHCVEIWIFWYSNPDFIWRIHNFYKNCSYSVTRFVKSCLFVIKKFRIQFMYIDIFKDEKRTILKIKRRLPFSVIL